MSDYETWNELGNLYFMDGAYDPAIHAYLRSIQMNRGFGRSYSNLAMAFVHTERYAEAIKLYRRSLDLLTDAREKAITWNRLGVLYRLMKDYPNAMEAYRQADLILPREDRGDSGGLPLAVSRPDVDLDEILQEPEAPKEPKKPAPLQRMNGILQSVKAKFALTPQDEGLVLLDQEEVKRAVPDRAAPAIPPVDQAEIDALIEPYDTPDPVITPMLQYAQETPALQLVTVSTPEIAKFRAATMKDPKDIDAWEQLGLACKSAGLYADAIRAFETAISINPHNAENYYHLGLNLAAERREEEAVEAFETVINLDSHHSLAHASLASHYRKIGRHDLAEKHLKKARGPRFDEQSEYNKACLEAICGNPDNALEYLRTALSQKQTGLDWVRKDPDLECLHNDLRFQDLLATYAA